MEQPKAPNFRRLAVFMVLFLILSLVLLFFARDVIREVVVLPLSYIFWGLGVLVDFTPQWLFWILILFIAFQIAYPSLIKKRRPDVASVHTILDPSGEQATRGRVSFWATRAEFLRPGQSAYFSRSFHSALGKLLLDMLAYRYRLTPNQIENGLREGTIDLPADVREYALDSLRPAEIRQVGFFAGLWDQMLEGLREAYGKLRGIFLSLTGSSNHGSRNQTDAQRSEYIGPQAFNIDASALTDGRIRQVIEFMEDELEVLHDDTGR